MRLAELLSHTSIRNLNCAYMETATEEAQLAAAAAIAHTEHFCELSVAGMRLEGLIACSMRLASASLGCSWWCSCCCCSRASRR